MECLVRSSLTCSTRGPSSVSRPRWTAHFPADGSWSTARARWPRTSRALRRTVLRCVAAPECAGRKGKAVQKTVVARRAANPDHLASDRAREAPAGVAVAGQQFLHLVGRIADVVPPQVSTGPPVVDRPRGHVPRLVGGDVAGEGEKRQLPGQLRHEEVVGQRLQFHMEGDLEDERVFVASEVPGEPRPHGEPLLAFPLAVCGTLLQSLALDEPLLPVGAGQNVRRLSRWTFGNELHGRVAVAFPQKRDEELEEPAVGLARSPPSSRCTRSSTPPMRFRRPRSAPSLLKIGRTLAPWMGSYFSGACSAVSTR